MISKIKKLRGRSLLELAERGRQRARILRERAGWSNDLRWPEDTEFFKLFSGCPCQDADGILAYFIANRPRFYPSFERPAETVAALRSRFQREESILTAQAEKIVDGKLDLLGFDGLDFGGSVPDWHLDPISGIRSPLRHWSLFGEIDPRDTGDKKVVWELNRHQYLTVLGRLYLLTCEEELAKVFTTHIEDWIDKNPPKMGVNWLSSLEIAYRSISWVWCLHSFIGSAAFTPQAFVKMLKCLYLNGRHLERNLSTYSSPNTHLTGEAFGLYILGTYLNMIPEADGWKSAGYDILMNALDFQVREDGGYVEQAVHYHRYTADIYLSLYILRIAEGIPIDPVHEAKLRSLLGFLTQITQPNGETPLIGDDDGGRLHFLETRSYSDFRSTLAVGSAVLSDPEMKYAAGEAGPEVLWLTGAAGIEAFDKLLPREPAELASGSGPSGFYSARTNWRRDAAFVLIDCGPHGFLNGGHAHADALSFVLSVEGTPVFVDSGTFDYLGDPSLRDHFRSSAAHNCLIVDGDSSSIPDGPFSWESTAAAELLEWRASGEEVLFRGTHDGYERLGVKYERELSFNRQGRISLADKVESAAASLFQVSFILDPGIEAEVRSSSNVVLRAKEGNRTLLVIDTKLIGAEAAEDTGWSCQRAPISRRYGSISETTRICYSHRGSGNIQIINSFTFDGSSV